MPLSWKQAAEYQRLIVEQATVTRDARYAPLDAEAKALSDARAERLRELATLADYSEPERAVNDAIAAWIRMNPRVLNMRRIADILQETLYDIDRGGVTVVIGDLTVGGFQYRLMFEDLRWSGARTENIGDEQVVSGDLVLTVPDSVAEHFRQQGRRDLQAEMRQLLNVSRA